MLDRTSWGRTMMRHLIVLRYYWGHISATIIVAAIVAVVVFLTVGVNIRTSQPDAFQPGVITGFRLVEELNVGSVLMVFVRLKDGQTVVVRIGRRSRCEVGSTVSVREAHTLIGSRFSLAPFQCLNPK